MSLYAYDEQVREEGFPLLCGIDEAGRGPLAGPVYAAAVILPLDFKLEGLNDSKKLSEKKRDALYDKIIAGALTYGIASASEDEIDKLNILGATMLAMRKAAEMLEPIPSLALVDGNASPGLTIPTRTVIGGDAISASIAAASILAKVSRDRKLLELDKLYPDYLFAKHKGYPTKLHYEMLDKYGASPVHRNSFLKKWRAKQGDT